MELEKRIDASEQQNDQQTMDSSNEPEVKAGLCKIHTNSKGNGRCTHINKASKSLQDPKHVQERLEIVNDQKGCERKRTFINFVNKKKAELKNELEQIEDPTKEAKLKYCIDCISKDIDDRIQEERGHHKVGCELLKKLNEFALKRARRQRECNVKGCKAIARLHIHAEDVHGLSGFSLLASWGPPRM